MHFAHVAITIAAAFAALFATAYLTLQIAVRVEPACLAAHLPQNFCGLFGVAKVGDDDTGALRAGPDEPRPSPTTTALPTPTISLAGPSPSSDGGWEPAGEEGSKVSVDAGPKTAVTVIARPDTATATNQIANDITAKVVLERLVVPASDNLRSSLKEDQTTRDRPSVIVDVLWTIVLAKSSGARGQDQPLEDSIWAPPPPPERVALIAGPEQAPKLPRVRQEAEERLDAEVGMEEAPPALQGELAVEGDSLAEPASQQAEPADDFPPAEGLAPEDPLLSPSGHGADSEVAASLADEVPAALETASCEPRGAAASEDGSGSVAPASKGSNRARPRKGRSRAGQKVQSIKRNAAARAAKLAQCFKPGGRPLTSRILLLPASPAGLVAIPPFRLSTAVSLNSNQRQRVTDLIDATGLRLWS
ncbi:MAG: hypothetical protein M1826_002458 [Phylliscum demangeonii]|nr:MAG: hypothetical protein M1826_002458 [Phylliscum demangeonii]